jgi:hypothetical protein
MFVVSFILCTDVDAANFVCLSGGSEEERVCSKDSYFRGVLRTKQTCFARCHGFPQGISRQSRVLVVLTLGYC